MSNISAEKMPNGETRVIINATGKDAMEMLAALIAAVANTMMKRGIPSDQASDKIMDLAKQGVLMAIVKAWRK